MRTCRGTKSERLTIEQTSDGDRPVLLITGEIDVSTADQFRSAIEGVLADHHRVEIDLREMTFMDSTGLAVLIGAHQSVGQIREAVRLRHAPSKVVRPLEITSVSELVDLEPDGVDGYRPPPV